jgi:hypothetical protein
MEEAVEEVLRLLDELQRELKVFHAEMRESFSDFYRQLDELESLVRSERPSPK